jgi:hypothetical protein
MIILKIDLQEGFVNDEVVMAMNDTVFFEKKSIRTRTQIGLADQVEVEVRHKQIQLRINVKSKALVGELTMKPKENMFLGISIGKSNELIFKQQSEPFRYL